jgi:hypothetical protein
MIEFYQVLEGKYLPMKADPSALGSIPTSGYRYCEPVRTSSGFGWYMFLPLELGIIYEDGNVYFSLDGFETRSLLVDAIQFPGFPTAFDAAAPAGVEGYAPPFVARTNDEDMLQIWTGAFARTRADISLWVRGPVNVWTPSNAQVVEGVVETDWWFGPLFANVRFPKEGVPVVFRKDRPFLQVLPFSRSLSVEFTRSEPTVQRGLEGMADLEWDDYDRTIVKRLKGPRPPGEYAVMSRRKAKSLESPV